MRVSIFTDEISHESPSLALQRAKEWGVTHVEVRNNSVLHPHPQSPAAGRAASVVRPECLVLPPCAADQRGLARVLQVCRGR